MTRFTTILMALALLLAAPVFAQNREVPYWASIKWEEVNMRVGPGENYPIKWKYVRKGLPFQVIRVVDGWRLVKDPDGEQGWVVARSLTPNRAAYVVGEDATEMREAANLDARILWRVEPGVSGRLGECRGDWCELDVTGRVGWIAKSRLWGVEQNSKK